MTEPTTDQLFLGAYAMAPTEPAAETAFYAGVAELSLRGLEFPLTADGAPQLSSQWIHEHVQPQWDLLVTCIPTTMSHLASDGEHGLASTDDDARARALADVARARDLALRLADEHGRRRVIAIQVHSAPGPGRGSREAFARSLTEIAGWDLAGAQVLAEHCDARVPRQTAAKGFLSLDDEIMAIRHVLHDPARVRTSTADAAPLDELFGLSVNWGRSAIEGRSSATPVEHVQTAVDSGLLRAVVFSGATDEAGLWGPAWSDAHIPPRGPAPALDASSSSLLGAEEIRATLDAIGPDVLVAVKVAVRPRDADVATRVAVARAALSAVVDARPAP